MGKILITSAQSTLTLDLARQLHAAGHEIVVCDTTACHSARFSNCVAKSLVIPSPRLDKEAFIESLVTIVKSEEIDFLLPVYEEILYIAKEKHRFPSSCIIFCDSFEKLHRLHNKWFFHETLQSLDIASPKTVLIRSREDLKTIPFTSQYALKASYSRASLCVKKVLKGHKAPDIEIEESNPWVAQEWLEGTRFCSYSICHNGIVNAHVLYPVGFAIDGKSCLVFESVDNQLVFEWTKNIVEKLNFTGQIAFDFVMTQDHQLYAIECNPRATSGLYLFSESNLLDKALFNQLDELLLPQLGVKRQIVMGMTLYGWRKNAYPSNTFKKFFDSYLGVRDVVYNRRDLKPVFLVPLVFLSIWLNCKKKGITIPAAFTHDMEWNGTNAEERDLRNKIPVQNI